MRTIPADEVRRLKNALPFWLSLGTVPLALFGALHGGWAVALLPIYSWGMFSVLDALIGLNEDNPDPDTPAAGLFWYRVITLIWFPVQAGLLFWLIWYVPQAPHLGLAYRAGAAQRQWPGLRAAGRRLVRQVVLAGPGPAGRRGGLALVAATPARRLDVSVFPASPQLPPRVLLPRFFT